MHSLDFALFKLPYWMAYQNAWTNCVLYIHMKQWKSKIISGWANMYMSKYVERMHDALWTNILQEL